MVWAKSILGRENTKHNGHETEANVLSVEQKEGQCTCGILGKVEDEVRKTSADYTLLAGYQMQIQMKF